MAISKTSIHAGQVINDLLLNDLTVRSFTKRIFPIVVNEAELPYITYRRTGSTVTHTAVGHDSETVEMCVSCLASEYGQSIQLAEAVRNALSGARYNADDLNMRCCSYEGGEEDWQDDAFIQQLYFKLKIN
jgi:hypothetical protein